MVKDLRRRALSMKGSLILIGVAALGISAGLIFTIVSKNLRPDTPETPTPFKVAAWDGASFITKDDVKAMGADMSSPAPLVYRREGPSHFYQMGMNELEAKIWAYELKEGAQKRFEEECSDDRKQCEVALRKKMASVADFKAGRKMMLRSDGWGVVTIAGVEEKFVVKIMRCEKTDDPAALKGIEERARTAYDYLIKKLRTSR